MRVKNFLKSDPGLHKDPAVRLAYVNEMDASREDSQNVLATLASSDEDPEVRGAAIDKLSDVSALQALLDDAHEPARRDAVERRIAACLEDGIVPMAKVVTLLASHADRLGVTVAAHSANAEQRELAMQHIADDQGLLNVVQYTRFHDTRQVAASRLQSDEAVREALVACRARDKVVARQLQQRLDDAAAQLAAQQERIEAVAATLSGIESLADSVWSPQHAGRLQAAVERWSGLPVELTKAHQEAFDASVTRVQAAIDSHVPVTPPVDVNADAAISGGKSSEAKSSEGSSAEAAAVSQSAASSDAMSDASDAASTGTPTGDEQSSSPSELAVETAGSDAASQATESDTTASSDAAPEAPPADPSLDPLRSALHVDELIALGPAISAAADASGMPTTPAAESIVSHATAVAVLFDPPFDLARARPQAIEERQGRIDTLVDTNTLLAGVDVQGFAHITLLSAHRDALQQRLGKAKQESADRVAATHRQFAAMSGMIGEGKWGPASSMLRRVQKKIGQMESRERASVADKLNRVEQQLNEMADWQDFAARPKLEALCDAMEALPAAEMTPPSLATEVKRLQAEWKALGASRASNELWTRFKTAGDAAFAPCKVFFEEKQQERKHKLEAKAALCVTLEETLPTIDWEQPDWKAIQRLVQNAKRDWSRQRVSDRKPDKSLETRFSKALEPFESRLAAEYDTNATLRQELVDKVAKLAEGEHSQHTINQTRSLQAAWKQVGIMRRRQDQALWELFNGHCRTLFKRQQGIERDRHKASMGHVLRAREIIKSLKQLANKGAPDEQAVQTLVSEFNALEAFPDRDRKFLERDFRGALDACSREQAKRVKRRAEAGQEEMLRRVALCEQLEDIVESPADYPDTLRDDIAHAWDSSEVRLSRDVLTQLEARRDRAMAHIEAGTCFDYAAAEEVRRDLLVRLEVASEKETPAEDKARRMQFQLAHLKEGMTSAAVTDTRAVLSELSQLWHAAPPVRRSLRDSLNSRFLNATGR